MKRQNRRETAMRLVPLVLALALAAPLPAAAAQQPPPRDPRVSAPVVLPKSGADEAELARRIEANPADLANYIALATSQEQRGATGEAEATWMAAKKAGTTPDLLKKIALFHSRTGNFDRAVATLEEAAALAPNDPAALHLITSFYQEKVSKDKTLSEAQRWKYVLQGISAADRALAIKPDYLQAMVYKGILLREQANLEPDPGQQKVLIDEADRLRKDAIELQRGATPRTEQAVMAQPHAPAPPPPPCPGRAAIDGQAPVRVGGNIPAPVKTRNAAPVYPPDAQEGRIQGVVILEIVVSPSGQVVAPCVLRSIPMLDQAAIDAVSQWEFEPTQLNGGPVPVIMTVTVNFTLQER
jgi:TonB family protein